MEDWAAFLAKAPAEVTVFAGANAETSAVRHVP